jgi:hypothetical protein
MRTRLLALGLLHLVGALSGCGDCSDEVEAANKFLEDPANLVCQSNEDCTVVSTGCAEPRRASCGQASLSRAAAASAKWQQVEEDLVDCDNSCAQCDALLLPTCTSGLCGGPL